MPPARGPRDVNSKNRRPATWSPTESPVCLLDRRARHAIGTMKRVKEKPGKALHTNSGHGARAFQKRVPQGQDSQLCLTTALPTLMSKNAAWCFRCSDMRGWWRPTWVVARQGMCHLQQSLRPRSINRHSLQRRRMQLSSVSHMHSLACQQPVHSFMFCIQWCPCAQRHAGHGQPPLSKAGLPCMLSVRQSARRRSTA